MQSRPAAAPGPTTAPSRRPGASLLPPHLRPAQPRMGDESGPRDGSGGPAVMAAAEEHQYVLCVLLGSGTPWSEHKPGTDFTQWFTRTFQDTPESVTTSVRNPGEQQHEYVTAYPTRANSHPLLKHRDGVVALPAREFPYNPGSSVILIIRNVLVSGGLPPVIFCGRDPAIAADKLWCAVQVDQWCAYEPISRETHLRAHPDSLAEVFPTRASREDCLGALWNLVEEGLKRTQAELSSPGTRGSARATLRDRRTNLRCMKKLLKWRQLEEEVEEKKSTLWNPVDARRDLITPTDILKHKCSCARALKFHQHMSKDCLGGGLFAVTSTTYYEEDGEVIPALIHASKASMLSTLRTGNVDFDSLLRVQADKEAPDTLWVVATLNNFHDKPGQRSSSSRDGDEIATDKHRMLWLVPLDRLREFLHQPAKGAAKGSGQPAVGATLGESRLWQEGSLHVIVSAPKGANYQWRMTIAPPAPEEGKEYFGIVLSWCGDMVFQHAALLKAAATQNVLGVARKLFWIFGPAGMGDSGRNVLQGLLSDEKVEGIVAPHEALGRPEDGPQGHERQHEQRAEGRSARRHREDVAGGLHAGSHHSDHY